MKKLLLHSLLISLSCQAAAFDILTAHPITIGIAETLLAEEIAAQRIRILPAAPKTLPATRQLNYLQGRGKDNLKNLSQEADIVLTVRSIFAQDYLYPFSRRHNIRIIPIDLATPIDGERAGVSKQAQDFLQHPVWLDPYNLSLMYSTLAQELQAYDPALQLENALHQEQKRLIALKNDMETFLNEQEAEPVVLLLNPELSYFTQGLQLGSITASPDSDIAELINTQGITLIISENEADENIAAQAEAAGVKILILPRLSSDNPTEQLAKHYETLKTLLRKE